MDRITIEPSERILLEGKIQEYITDEEVKFKLELDNLRREKEKLEHKQDKLLEAHFNDAIPLDLMKRQQQVISKQLSAIEHEMKLRSTTFEEIRASLSMAFDLIEDCGRTYRYAKDGIKRLMIQAIYEKIWIDDEEKLSYEFSEVYKNIVAPIENELAKHNEKSAPDHSDADFSSRLLKSYSKFFDKGLNNGLLVEHRGVEPLTSTMRMSRANEFSVLHSHFGLLPGCVGC